MSGGHGGGGGHAASDHSSDSHSGGGGGSKAIPGAVVIVIGWVLQPLITVATPQVVHLSMEEGQRSADLSVDEDPSDFIKMHQGCLPKIDAEYPFVVVVAGRAYHSHREPYLPKKNPKVEGTDKLFWSYFQLKTEAGCPEQEITVSVYIPPGTEVAGVE